MIEGVKIKQLREIKDKRGRLMEIFRFSQTGIIPKQVYMTTAYKGITKDKDSFHMHKKQTDNFCCIKGRIRLVLVDTRRKSPSYGEVNEFEIGEGNFCLVTIPKRVLHAFKGLKGESYVINCINNEYNKEKPDEFRIKNMYYDWGRGRRL